MLEARTRARTLSAGDWPALLAIAAAAILIHGYHLGIEDQTLYLPAIKKILDPSLYPHDAIFFASQTRFTALPRLVAWSVRLGHLPLDLAVCLWHAASMLGVLLGCLALARRLVPERAASWAGVATVAILLPFPVAGTHIGLMDPYLHPRALATAALLFAFVAAVDRRSFRMLGWLVAAGAMHPLMAVAGAIHVLAQAWPARVPAVRPVSAPQAAVVSEGLGLAGGPPDADAIAWPDIVWSIRRFYFPLRWTWYEWAGVIVPVFVLGWLTRLGPKRGLPVLTRVSRRLLISACAGIALALMLTGGTPTRLVLLQPMRTLHLVYVILFLLVGCAIGRRFLGASPVRWALYLLPMAAFVIVLQPRFPWSPHIEWPGTVPSNPWVEAFDWARRNTPRDARFALDPQYMRGPGSDGHSFRAFAERSTLAEAVHDPGPALMSPALAVRWRDEVRDLEGWQAFTRDDFHRLHRTRGVDWIVIERPPAGMSCPYRNAAVAVCRVDRAG